MYLKKSRLLQVLAVTGLVATGLLLAISPTFGLNKFLKNWNNIYPHSASGDANCSICHGTSNGNLNSYGKDLCDTFGGTIPADSTAALLAIAGKDSDGNGDINEDEINNGAQPGWTVGAINQIYLADVSEGCLAVGDPISPPANVPLPYDPPAGGEPVAIPGGPYAGNVNVPVTFDGSASYDSDETGIIDEYAWDFGDDSTGTGMVPQHTYTAPGTYIVTLTVTDDEGQTDSAETTATISADDVLDLDIAAFKVTQKARVGKPIAINLQVTNDGPILGQAFATVKGMQDGVNVYEWRLNVYDYPDQRDPTFEFPSYTPTAKGTINWTATIADVDPDDDLATATTVVK